MVNTVSKYPNLTYFDEAEDTPSIISIKVMHPSTGLPMKKSELADVFKALTLDMSEKFPEAEIKLTKNKCFIGQPVLINENEAVLRIALGSDSLRDLVSDFDETLKQDEQILAKMSFLGS